MTWMAWRQVRTSAAATGALLVALVVLLLVTGLHLNHLYSAFRDCQGLACTGAQFRLESAYPHLSLIGTALVALPAVLGVFIGAPLVSRELENGTYRLAWTQSVSRSRWIGIRVGLGALFVAASVGLMSFAFSWWSIPFDRTGGDNRIVPSIFDQRGVVPVAYALFAFALGVAVGALLRRTLAAMAVTLGGFIAARMVVQFLVRPRLMAPLHRLLALDPRSGVGLKLAPGGGAQLVPSGRPELHAAWVTGAKIVDSSGHAPTSAAIRSACRQMLSQAPPPAPSGPGPHVKQATPQAIQAFQNCLSNLGTRYHEVVSYQPASRFWQFQWLESAIFLGAAGLLIALAVYWVRRRLT